MLPRPAVTTLAAAGILVGCGSGVGIPKVPHAVGLADRCSDIVTAALPFDIEIKSRSSANAGIDKIVARVEATRSDLAKDSPATRDFTAECEFDNSTLSAFRWIKGGPHPQP